MAVSSLRRPLLFLALVAAAGGAAFLVHRSWQPSAAAALVPGVVRETEIHVAPEVTGRLASVLVVAGQEVREGDLLATLSNPELAASVEEAKSALAKARADRDNVFADVRKEEVDISGRYVEMAKANLTLARLQFKRASALAGVNFASQQRLDEATAALRTSEANLASLSAAYARNKAGATKEDKAIAEAKVALAQATLKSLEAKLAKTRLTAPVDGVVRILVATPGEVISAGQSVMTLEAGRERWFTLTIREDSLKGVTIGSPVRLFTAKGAAVAGRVTELRPLGEFATWRAARAAGDHDLNSFLVRIDPFDTHENLEPGMTMWLDPGALSHSANPRVF